MSNFGRRGFLKSAAVGTAGVVLAGCNANLDKQAQKVPPRQGKNVCGMHTKPLKKVRIGIIGIGMRGPGAVKRLASIEGTEIVAVCDIRKSRVDVAQRILKDKKRPKAFEYFGSEDAWKKLCERDDIDLVYACTPWELHTPNCVYAMNHGKHVAVEVPAALTVKECWELVNTSERTQRHCMMLENCCYDAFEMMTLNMVRKGVLGDLIHGEAAYIHDLRHLNFKRNGYYNMWRLRENAVRNGNLYPTHGLGPVSQCMNINRGDKFEYLTSLSSNDFMMQNLAKQRAKNDSFFRKFTDADFRGNMNTTLIKTAKGRSIMVQHDVTSPRPYSRIHMLSGTKGFAQKWPNQLISLDGYTLADGKKTSSHRYLNKAQFAEVYKKYQHPLYSKKGTWAKKLGGHGGMDSIMDWRLIYCLKNGLPVDQDVYDAAAWSVISPLTEWSVSHRSNSIDVPDFTRGSWKTNKPLMIKA